MADRKGQKHLIFIVVPQVRIKMRVKGKYVKGEYTNKYIYIYIYIYIYTHSH